MGRLSTLVYAPVLFTLLTACGPRRANEVAARVAAPKPAAAPQAKPARQTKPTAAQPATTVVETSDAALAMQLEEAKHKLTYAYFIDFRPDQNGALPPTWDPMDVAAPMRKEIEAHLKMMLNLYQKRLQISPRPELILEYHHTDFILREFQAQDAREAGK